MLSFALSLDMYAAECYLFIGVLGNFQIMHHPRFWDYLVYLVNCALCCAVETVLYLLGRMVRGTNSIEPNLIFSEFCLVSRG